MPMRRRQTGWPSRNSPWVHSHLLIYPDGCPGADLIESCVNPELHSRVSPARIVATLTVRLLPVHDCPPPFIRAERRNADHGGARANVDLWSTFDGRGRDSRNPLRGAGATRFGR